MVLEEDKLDLEVRQRAEPDRPNNRLGCCVWSSLSPGIPLTSDSARP